MDLSYHKGSVTGGGQAPFIPAQAFQGGKPGYVFKLGDKGLGYYVDAGGRVGGALAGKTGPSGFQPASKFEGARPGYVFKLGRLGLGYYADTYDLWMASAKTGGRGLTSSAGLGQRLSTASKRGASEGALIGRLGTGRKREEAKTFARAGGKMLGLG
uniref:Uncharacterized protein n=1 Tax=Alexandrium monilatum TaxID=311494 RepID=A0A7S4UAQ2_9DINO|mmetsp:Transcript_48515/g.144914  ORF Transcript_48515/g.144914 Transcript_48515/m.144914 type:complete len:157 (-) Transcript_48515:100-570(-)